jgi:hypothetical protein
MTAVMTLKPQFLPIPRPTAPNAFNFHNFRAFPNLFMKLLKLKKDICMKTNSPKHY